MKKRRILYLIPVTSLLLSSCSFKDVKNWFLKLIGRAPQEEQHEEQNNNNNNQQKVITGIVKVNAPQQIEQGQSLTSVQVEVSYSDGTTGTVSSTSVDLNTNTVGQVTGTAFVGNFSATFIIEVYSNNIATHYGTFTSTSGSVTPGADFTDITLVNAESDSIEVRAEKVNVNETGLIAQKNSYFIIYNKLTSPLNDISDLQCSWNHVPNLDSYETVVFGLYFSYNFLSLDDILAGYYQDLAVYTGTFSVHGASNSFSSASGSITAPNARYFLALVQTPSSDLSLTGMQVVSSSSEAPTPVDKGVYAYPEGVAESFGGFNEGFPFFGNGSISFDIDEDEANLVTLQRQGKYNWFISQLTSNGFVYATELMGLEVYQKRFDSSTSYTYALRKYEFSGFELIQLTYAGLYTTMIEETSWPGEAVKAELLNNTYKALVTDPGFTGTVSYVSMAQQNARKNTVGVIINQKDSEKRDQYIANGNILKVYLKNFVDNHGFVYKSEWGGDFTEDSFSYSASVRSGDFRFEVSGAIMFDPDGQYNLLQLSFTENSFGEFPTSAIRGCLGDNSFPVLTSANGEFTYSDEDNNRIKITALGVTKAELDAYWTVLDNYGMSVNDYDSSGGYHYYSAQKLVVSSAGAFTYRVYAYLYADRVEMTYEKSDAYYTNSFASVMGNISYNLNTDIATAVGEEFSNGHFIYDSENKVIYAMGYSQAEAQQLLNVCDNDLVLGSYVFYDEVNPYKGAIKISVEVMENYLIIHAIYINSSAWSNYKNEENTSNVNGLIDDLFDEFSQPNPSDYYLGANQLVFYRSSYSNNISAYGATVASVIDAYKTTLLANTNIKYSAYLDKYINISTGVAVSFDLYEDEPIPHATIQFSFGEDFKDFVQYSEIATELSVFEHLNLYPSLDILGENQAGFVFDYADTDYASVHLSEEAYNTYLSLIEANNNFAEITLGTYQYVDVDGNVAQVSFYEWNHSVYFTYTSSFFTTINSIKEEFDSNSFTFYENYVLPSQSGNIFRCNSYWDTYFSIQFAKNRFNEDAYVTELLAYGFKESHEYSTHIVYTKIVGHVSYVVDIDTNYIYYRTTTYDLLVSYADLVNTLTSYGFESAKLDNFVAISGMENNYYLNNGWSYEFTVLISNGEVTLEAYVEALLSAGYVADIDNAGYYNKGETTVYVYDYDGFLMIQYHDERIIYKSFAEVVSKATSDGFDARVLDYVLAPSQTGNLYSFSYCSSSRLEFYFDAEAFDLDAYKDDLVQDGYTKNGSSYEKGDASVYISSSGHWIELTYNGSLE